MLSEVTLMRSRCQPQDKSQKPQQKPHHYQQQVHYYAEGEAIVPPVSNTSRPSILPRVLTVGDGLQGVGQLACLVEENGVTRRAERTVRAEARALGAAKQRRMKRRRRRRRRRWWWRLLCLMQSGRDPAVRIVDVPMLLVVALQPHAHSLVERLRAGSHFWGLHAESHFWGPHYSSSVTVTVEMMRTRMTMKSLTRQMMMQESRHVSLVE